MGSFILGPYYELLLGYVYELQTGRDKKKKEKTTTTKKQPTLQPNG